MAIGPQGGDGIAMGEADMVHGMGGGADVTQAGRVDAQKMRQPRHAPGFVDRGGRGDTVADPAHDDARVIGEPARDVRVHPAAAERQVRRQVPVIEGQEGFQPARQHPVDQPVVEIETFRVRRPAPLGHHPRPACRKAVGVETAVAKEVQILRPAVVMVAGGGAVLAVQDIAGRGGEAVPMAAPGTAKACALDLIGGGGGPEEEARRKGGAGKAHDGRSCQLRSGAGPVDWPMVSSASNSRSRWGRVGSAMRRISISAAIRPASRTEERTAV